MRTPWTFASPFKVRIASSSSSWVQVSGNRTIGAEYFSPGQTVIDVGTNWSDEKGKLVGDVAFDDVEPLVDAITPVPGGVGAVTTSVLASHVIEAARR